MLFLNPMLLLNIIPYLLGMNCLGPYFACLKLVDAGH